MTFAVHLSPCQFTAAETVLVGHPEWRVSGLRCSSDIAALKIAGSQVEAVVLPWRGQQIWSLAFNGEPVGMKGMTEMPAAGQGLLDSFGAFFFHCGLFGTSAPGPRDTHPQHGELPVGAMSEAWIEIEALTGTLTVRSRRDHAQAFRGQYRAEPFVRFTPGMAEITIGIEVSNPGRAPLPFMYMGHPNFRPIDGAELIWSGARTPDAVRLHTPISSAPEGSPQRALLQKFAVEPMQHAQIAPGRSVDPEAVFQLDYAADGDGWAHTLQVHPDGTSDAVSHRPAECPRALRWLSRQPDLDAVAIVEPATSWLGGFAAEREAGNVPEIAPRATWATEIRVARLDADETTARLSIIDRIAGRQETA